MTTDRKSLEYTSNSPHVCTKPLKAPSNISTPLSAPPPYRDIDAPPINLNRIPPRRPSQRSPRKMFLALLIGFLVGIAFGKLIFTARSRWSPCHRQLHQPTRFLEWVDLPPAELVVSTQPATVHDSTPPPEYEVIEIPNLEYRRRETVQSITGTIDLYNLIELTTVTGSIDITIRPQDSQFTGKRAVVRLRSATGSITVRLDDDFVADTQIDLDSGSHPAALDRIWDTEIITASGSVTANLIIGGGGPTVVRTSTGTVNLDLLAVYVGPKDPVTVLETLSQPGPQNVRVSSFGGKDGGKVSKLKGRHVANGLGNIDVQYPTEWEGNVEAVLRGMGTLDVGGDGLVIDEKDSWHVKGHRGDSNTDVSIIGHGTGVVKFRC